MNSSTSHCGRAQMVACDDIFPTKKKPPSSRRTPSFSSSSSSSFSSHSSSFGSSSYFPDDSPLSPATPLRFSGVPFSWEHLPGIPKNNNNNSNNKGSVQKTKESVLKQLPLPPLLSPQSLKKSHFDPDVGVKKKFNSNGDHSFRKDPFVAALVECSKGDDDDDDMSSKLFWNGGKVSRSISDRFRFIGLYTSCKRTCAVSESIVYLQGSRGTSYDLINHRRSR